MATSEPTIELKGVSAVTYDVFIDTIFENNKCNVDGRALQTNLDFVVNQSTTLAFVTDKEHVEQTHRLYDLVKFGDPNFHDAEKRGWI